MERYLAPLDHEDLLVRRGRRSGVYCIVAVHSTARGPALGGCRMWHYEDSRAGIRDALRLARAMTYKSAVAGLPLGGGKGVIMLRGEATLSPERRRAALEDFGDTVDLLGGAYITAEDVGTSAADMEVIAERTPHVKGLARERGGSGDPSPYTALGVVTAIEVCCERVFGSPGLGGRSVALAGLGHVGSHIARRLAEAGAELLVADVDQRKRDLAAELGARWVTPEEALAADVDVYAPCALGAVLNDDTVPELRCPIVAGAANNQLADDRIADLLNARGILWAPDFVANAGGIVNIAVELDEGGYDPERAEARVRGIGDTLRRVFDDAARMQATPLTAAMELARRNLAEAGGTMPATGTDPEPAGRL
ncbi:MAG TPA: Glu/Leu/Phe/Val dehydrogenase dimerization domain-containing protein [Solirubrobacteraceae bacterium]|nr:Glu/Leu/Phe/Val dehydrogenase dimerization domain-containing protein [Solirubrobacteraceae bacterium]